MYEIIHYIFYLAWNRKQTVSIHYTMLSYTILYLIIRDYRIYILNCICIVICIIYHALLSYIILHYSIDSTIKGIDGDPKQGAPRIR